MIVLLSAAFGVASVMGSVDFVMKRKTKKPDVDDGNGNMVAVPDEYHYLLIQPLGRKKLFGEATWNSVRGTPLKWQDGNKIQVMGAFKKKNLCLYFKGNKNSPFSVKSCVGMFGGTQAMQIGCAANKSIGKFQDVGTQSKLLPETPHGVVGEPLFTTQDDKSICDVDHKDEAPDSPKDLIYKVNGQDEVGSVEWLAAQDAADQAKYFRISKDDGTGTNKYLVVRMKPDPPVDDDQTVEDESKKEGNRRINKYEWERNVSDKEAASALFKWNKNRQIEVVWPTDARIDGKPICLEMGKKGKMGLFPYKVQKCDRTVDRGTFGCAANNLFGMAWNAKRYTEADAANDDEKKAFHLDKLDTLSYNGHDMCHYQS